MVRNRVLFSTILIAIAGFGSARSMESKKNERETPEIMLFNPKDAKNCTLLTMGLKTKTLDGEKLWRIFRAAFEISEATNWGEAKKLIKDNQRAYDFFIKLDDVINGVIEKVKDNHVCFYDDRDFREDDLDYRFSTNKGEIDSFITLWTNDKDFHLHTSKIEKAFASFIQEFSDDVSSLGIFFAHDVSTALYSLRMYEDNHKIIQDSICLLSNDEKDKKGHKD